MMNAHVRTSRDLRNKYSEIALILQNRDQVIITNKGRGEAVVIGIEDYAQYEQFLHHRYVMKALAEADEQAANPNTVLLSHDEVRTKLKEKYGF